MCSLQVIQCFKLFLLIQAAAKGARCDYALYAGASTSNDKHISKIASACAGLKMYLNDTFSTLKMDNLTDWMGHFENWPKHLPIVCHAESQTTAAVILMAELFNRSVHIAHVAREEEVSRMIYLPYHLNFFEKHFIFCLRICDQR